MHSKPPTLITQKQAFLYYLQNKNLDMLDVILSDEMTYFGATKSMFLKKLSELIEKQPLSILKKRIHIKQHKKLPTVYYFMLKYTHFANKFILEDNDSMITKMEHFKQKRSFEDDEVRSSFELFFGDDELANFIPTTDYIMNVVRCKQAHEELVNEQNIVFTSKDIFCWLQKHRLFYNEIKDDFLITNYAKFSSLYFGLEYLYEQLQNHREASIALETFSDINRETFAQWLLDYEQLFYCKALNFRDNFKNIDTKNNLFHYLYYKNIYFTGDDFFALVKFDDLYLNQDAIYQCKYCE